ncbi:membrane protein insertion efficiency factor YidD [Patescibacteria group bacterium]|nr:membrane protein insertion efficiency factor YidD [Patescibacteria group bacterium]
MARIVIFLINIYQKTISPDHGWFKNRHPRGYCKYYPSCSEYTKQSVQKYGIFGLFKGFFRVLRCNPWSKGGVDLA